MENTSKNFALQLGSLISLYVSIGALISLLFGVITLMFPDAAQFSWEKTSASAGIRTSIAVLIVFFPTYIALTRMVNQTRRTEQGTYLTLTKWLIYLSLLIGGGVLLGDLVMVLNSFLNGELTTRFILKALVVLVVVGAAFAYYLADVKGYWQTHEQDSIRYAMGMTAVVVISLVIGFLKIEAPGEVREMNIDRAQINDLQQIQSRVESYAVNNEKLPATIKEAFGTLSIPEASSGRMAYEYAVTGADSFEICAEFAYETSEGERSYIGGYVAEPYMIKDPYNWDHSAGEWCFERTLNQNIPTR